MTMARVAAARLLGAGARVRPAVTNVMATSAIRVVGAGGVSLRRHFSSNNGEERSDAELQQSFSGIFPKVRGLNALTEGDLAKVLTEVWATNPTSGYACLKVAAQLQNPLLKKYKFNFGDFLSGAKHAVLELKEAMASPELFAMRRSGRIQRNPTTDFLRETLAPHLYQVLCFPLPTGMEKSNVLTSMDMKVISVARIHTIIVNEEFLETRKDMAERFVEASRASKSMLDTLMRKALNDAPDAVEVDDVVVNTDGTLSAGLADGRGPDYPLDSVLAQVDVTFVTQDELRTKGGDIDQRLDRETWTFEACISGQVEERWTVAQLHGKAALNLWHI